MTAHPFRVSQVLLVQHSICSLTAPYAGKQHFLDASVAYKRAVLNCVDYLSKFGYTKEQVNQLCVYSTHQRHS